MEMDERMAKRRLEVMHDDQIEMMKKHGWIVHFVFETRDCEFDGMANIHTHGMAQNFNHPDLQIVLPIDPQTAHMLLIEIVEQVKQGRVFEANQRYGKIIKDFDILFIEAKEGERTVLRVILPDSQGKFPFDEDCEDVYDKQMNPLPNEENETIH